MILVVNDYDSLYSRFWNRLGETTGDTSILFKDPDRIRLVCFTGGEDVSPELYGHQNLRSSNSKARDEREVLIFEMAKKHQIPVSGICRGAQFLSVMYGNTMVQHLRKDHGGGHHLCQTQDGDQFAVTSSHHQMVVPYHNLEVLAWAQERLRTEDLVYAGPVNDLECLLDENGLVRITEAVSYKGDQNLPPMFACQFHAEWMDFQSEAAQWQLQKTRELCLGEKNAKSQCS